MRRFRNAVGPLVRKHRCQANLTQDGLAAKLQLAGLDLDRTAVAKIESRIRSVYDFELFVMARVLDVPVRKLFPSESEMRKILPLLVQGKI